MARAGGSPPGWRRWTFPLAAATLAPLVVLGLAELALRAAGAGYPAGFFVPVLLAFFIATVSFPIMSWLRSHKVPRSLAVLITVLVDLPWRGSRLRMKRCLRSKLSDRSSQRRPASPSSAPSGPTARFSRAS